jgi:GGDEF domain-containing protein
MKGTKKLSTVTWLLIIQLVIMVSMSLVVTKVISATIHDNTMEHLQTITNERAMIISEFVDNAERTLDYYSQADQIKNLLKADDPSQEQELIDSAFEYTKAYSEKIEDLEGIYVSEWNTHVLAQTEFKYPDTDMTTRTDTDSLKQLQDALVAAGDNVYNVGMITSPATGKQIISMYKGVFDDYGNPIGIVGLGIETKGLVKTLESLEIKGMTEVEYNMISVENFKVVLNTNTDLIGTTIEDKTVQGICTDLKAGGTKYEETFGYAYGGNSFSGSYRYISKYKWILMVTDNDHEVYAVSRNLRTYMIIFVVLIIGVVGVFAYLNKRQEKINQKLAQTIIKNNKTKDSLYTAMFKDVLTDVGNRIGFSMELDEVKPTSSDPYYFIMYNIGGFSEINTAYGNDIGDWALLRTVDTLKQVFKNGSIYRTGSDEFVVALPVREKDTTSEDVLDLAKDAYERLSAEQNTPVGKLRFEFKSAVIKKTGVINTSLITILKDIINKNPQAGIGLINYSDLSK